MKQILLKQKGFSLIELMIVMAIGAVLAVLIIGAISVAKKTSVESVHRANAKVVQVALETEYAKNKKYCGGTLNCSVDYSLQSAASALGKKLGPGHSQATSGGNECKDSGTDDGGGWLDFPTAATVSKQQQQYKIEIWDAKCENLLETYTAN